MHLQTASTALEQLFKDFSLNKQQQFSLLQTAIRPFITQGQEASTQRRLQYEIFQQDRLKLQSTPMQTPVKSEQPEIIHWTPTPIRSSCHPNNLMSQLRGQSIVSFQKVSKIGQKMKKRQLFDSLHIIKECITHLVQSVHRAYNHLACWRYGKQSKFQAQSIYISKLGGVIERLKNFKINGGVEESVKSITEECVSLKKVIPQYEKEFIKQNQEVNWPAPSQIFRKLIRQ